MIIPTAHPCVPEGTLRALGCGASTVPVLPFGIPAYGEDELVKYYKDLEDNYGSTIDRRFEDGTIHSLPQDYADQLEWKELTKITAKAYDKIPDKGKAMIFCENYGQAGAIAIIGKKHDLSDPVSFYGSFVYWVPISFDEPIEYFIYINNELDDDEKELFTDLEVIGSISNVNAREYGTTVYLCSEPCMDLYEFWKMVLAERLGNSWPGKDLNAILPEVENCVVNSIDNQLDVT